MNEEERESVMRFRRGLQDYTGARPGGSGREVNTATVRILAPADQVVDLDNDGFYDEPIVRPQAYDGIDARAASRDTDERKAIVYVTNVASEEEFEERLNQHLQNHGKTIVTYVQ